MFYEIIIITGSGKKIIIFIPKQGVLLMSRIKNNQSAERKLPNLKRIMKAETSFIRLDFTLRRVTNSKI